MIRQFIEQVDWTGIDLLIIDTPPGTSDEHISSVQIFQSLKCPIEAILITTPQNASLIDVRKEIEFCKTASLPILGLIENMSGFTCECGQICNIFSSGGGKSLADFCDIPFLGSISIGGNVDEIARTINP